MKKDDFFLIFGPKKIVRNKKKNTARKAPTITKEKICDAIQRMISPDDRELIKFEGSISSNIQNNPYKYFDFVVAGPMTEEHLQDVIDRMIEREKRVIWLEGYYSQFEESMPELRHK